MSGSTIIGRVCKVNDAGSEYSVKNSMISSKLGSQHSKIMMKQNKSIFNKSGMHSIHDVREQYAMRG
tara:strand:- start:584 stop:784 length:201 start_codon:yes stop_codon:yes gene_type:complete